MILSWMLILDEVMIILVPEHNILFVFLHFYPFPLAKQCITRHWGIVLRTGGTMLCIFELSDRVFDDSDFISVTKDSQSLVAR